MIKYVLFLPAVIWLIIILLLSGFPGNQLPKVDVWQFDKIIHTGIYFVLSFFLFLPYFTEFFISNNRFKIIVVIIITTTFYGGFMELLQDNVFINRSGSWLDFIANALGSVLGVICTPFMLKCLPIKRWLKIN